MHSERKKIPKSPRYSRSRDIAYQFILEQKINRLPVDPFILAEKNNWKIMTYTELMLRSKVSQKIVRALVNNSNDGGTLYCADTNEYCILYNDRVRSKGRIRWTIMHEIGHIVLNHFVDFPQTRISRGGLTSEEYNVLEKEADFFAFHVLAPPVVLHEIGVTSYVQIMRICQLSKEASINRYEYQINWAKRPYIDKKGFLIIVTFFNFIYQKVCRRCLYGIISRAAKYCPICGETLIWGQGKMIYNDGYLVDESGRAIKKCPRCENEELNYEGDYCSICGTYLINMCAETYDPDISRYKRSCNTPAAGNARYCVKCGNETTFFQQGLLKPWNEAKLAIEAVEIFNK